MAPDAPGSGSHAQALSDRGLSATQPALTYLEQFLEALPCLFHPVENPSGFIPLVVAQNDLMGSVVIKELVSRHAMIPDDVVSSISGYDDFLGSSRLRTSLAAYLKSTFMRDVSEEDVTADHIAIAAGAGAIIENLAFLLADAGDSAILPAPYYPAFDNDLQVRAKVTPVPAPELKNFPDAHGVSPAPVPTPASLAAAAADAVQKGTKPRMVIFTNPSNPLGDVVPAQNVQECMVWALRNKLHFVSDEVYANSVFDAENAPPFVSAAALKDAAGREAGMEPSEVDEYVHVVFGMSKDLCVSGLRVGCLYTKSQHVISALRNVSYFCGVPNPTQHALAALLDDTAWMKNFMETNFKKLKESRDAASAALAVAGIQHTRATAGLFLYADFTRVLKKHSRADEPTFEHERALFEALFKEARVLVTPGRDCHHPTPGWFRVCFAAVGVKSLEEAGRRLKRFIDAI